VTWLDRVPWWVTLLLVATVGLAPFNPQPHVVEKLILLVNGRLTRPIDIFDFFLHTAPWLLLALKLAAAGAARLRNR
jgi:hypothetical protein